MNHHIKFNYYSRIVNKTVTVEGKLKPDWATNRFVIDKVYVVKHELFTTDALHSEALEYYEMHKNDLNQK